MPTTLDVVSTHVGNTNSGVQTFTHSAAASNVKAVVLITVFNGLSARVSGTPSLPSLGLANYGGTDFVTYHFGFDSLGEQGRVEIRYLGDVEGALSVIPQGPQTVTFEPYTTGGGGNAIFTTCVTITSDTSLTFRTGSGSGGDASGWGFSVDLGTRLGFIVGGSFSGVNALTGLIEGYPDMTNLSGYDFGNQVTKSAITTVASGIRSFGYTQANDDAAYAMVVIQEPLASFTIPVVATQLVATPSISVFDIATGVTSGTAAFVGDTNLNFQLTTTQATLVSPSLLQFSKTPENIPFALATNVASEALAFTGSQSSYDIANAVTAGSLALTGENITLALSELYFLPVNEGQIVFNGSLLQADTSLVVDYATISLTGSNVTANNSLITSNGNLQLTPDDIFLQLGVVAGITINASPAPLTFTPNNLTAFTAIFNNRGKIDGQPQAIINTNNDSLTLYNRKGGYHSIDYGITTLQ